MKPGWDHDTSSNEAFLFRMVIDSSPPLPQQQMCRSSGRDDHKSEQAQWKHANRTKKLSLTTLLDFTCLAYPINTVQPTQRQQWCVNRGWWIALLLLRIIYNLNWAQRLKKVDNNGVQSHTTWPSLTLFSSQRWTTSLQLALSRHLTPDSAVRKRNVDENGCTTH